MAHDVRAAGVRAEMLIGLVMFARARGLTQDQIAEVTGLSTADLARHAERLPETSLHNLWKLVGEHCPGEAVALQLAALAPDSEFGVLASTLRYAWNLREALRTLTRYRMVLADRLEFTTIEGPEETAFRMSHPLDEVDGGHAAEAGMAFGARVGREVYEAGEALLRMEFRHPPHGPLEAYEGFFGVPVQFRMPCTAMVFRTECLDKQYQTNERFKFDYLLNRLDLEMPRLASTEPEVEPVARLRHELTLHAGLEYGADALARRLGISLRTLQRQLAAQGTSVSEVVEEVRQATAKRLLANRRLSIEEVAFKMGYSSSRAFRRACRRWSGLTPGELRAAQ